MLKLPFGETLFLKAKAASDANDISIDAVVAALQRVSGCSEVVTNATIREKIDHRSLLKEGSPLVVKDAVELAGRLRFSVEHRCYRCGEGTVLQSVSWAAARDRLGTEWRPHFNEGESIAKYSMGVTGFLRCWPEGEVVDKVKEICSQETHSICPACMDAVMKDAVVVAGERVEREREERESLLQRWREEAEAEKSRIEEFERKNPPVVLISGEASEAGEIQRQINERLAAGYQLWGHIHLADGVLVQEVVRTDYLANRNKLVSGGKKTGGGATDWRNGRGYALATY